SKVHVDGPELESWNYLFQEFFSNGISRVAVPFFALTSGFFLAKQLQSDRTYKTIYSGKIKTLILPYIIGSTAIFFLSETVKWIDPARSNSTISPEHLFHVIVMHPKSIQFWFLRDLIILTLASPILFTKERVLAYGATAIMGVSWWLDYQPLPVVSGWYLVNIETLFYFMLGRIAYDNKDKFFALVNIKGLYKSFILFVWLILTAVRVYIDPKINVWYDDDYTLQSILIYKTAIAVGVISLMQLSVYLANNKTIIYLSGLTFFAYLFHFVPLVYMRDITYAYFDKAYAFYINFPLCLLVVFGLAHVCAKYSPLIFARLTGGRDPRKSLQRVSNQN
ncbi:acyltransferase, partial [Vibrio sp.]|nr:acyltransferase [Vibrio sp.]